MKDQNIVEMLKTKKLDKAFYKLYSYFPQIEKLILSKGGSKEDAKDVYQQALIILYKKVQKGDFTLTSSLNTYLYSISRFVWSDELKRRGKQQIVEVSQIPEELITSVEDNGRLVLAEKALKNLGKKCMAILKMFYIQELRMKEIAEDLGYSSEKVAKNQKYKCLERAKLKVKELQTQKV